MGALPARRQAPPLADFPLAIMKTKELMSSPMDPPYLTLQKLDPADLVLKPATTYIHHIRRNVQPLRDP
jgi:hypothetical protein